MPIKVSVIVPVYNPGPHIEDCIGSVLRQSLPDDAYEAIFVDDGSTDETPGRLDELAAEHPNVRVIHQENSGWSGKPRNVGIEAATGEYVFFADNDDSLGDEALARMYAYARENDADIVIGKMAGKGRGVPRELFRRNHPKATLENAPLIDSLTPHKLFRRSFLDEHGLRFPEERRRLEDHVFVTAAFFAAKNISVLSDYVCYYHIRRDDAANAGFQQIEPRGYFANLREALEIVKKNTEPGKLRDRLYRRWYRVEMIERLRGDRVLQMTDEDRLALFDEVRAISTEMFGPGVAAGLPPTQRALSGLIRDGRLDDVVQLAEWEVGIRARSELEDLSWADGALRIRLRAWLDDAAGGPRFRTRADRDLVDLPLGSESAPVPDDDLDATQRLTASKVDVLVRERGSQAEFYLPVRSTYVRDPVEEEGVVFRPLLRAEGRFDPEQMGGGSPLPDGLFDVIVRVRSCGWTKDCQVRLETGRAAYGSAAATLVGESSRLAASYSTDGPRTLAVDLGQQLRRLDRDLVVGGSLRARGRERDLTVSVGCRVDVGARQPAAGLRLVHQETGRAVEHDAALRQEAGTGRSVLVARVNATLLERGTWNVQVRLAQRGSGRFVSIAEPLTLPVPSRAGRIGRTATSTRVWRRLRGTPVGRVLRRPGIRRVLRFAGQKLGGRP